MQGARVQGVQSFPVAFPLAPLLTALNTLNRVLCPYSYSQLHAQLSVGVLCFVGGWCFPDGQRSAEEGSEPVERHHGQGLCSAEKDARSKRC